jgi:hypothetical protein
VSYQPVIIESGVSFIFMTVGLLVAAGSLQHFPPEKQTEGNQSLGNAQHLGLFLSVNAVVSSDQLPKGAVTCVFIDGLCFKIENLCPSTAFFYVSIFAVEKATKNRKLSLRSKRHGRCTSSPVKGRNFDSIG